MAFTSWQPGTAVASPVYLDSGVLVSAFVRRDARYEKTAQLMGELLVAQVQILLSVLTLSESLWIIAKLSYCELFNHKASVNWNETIFGRHREAIFSKYGVRMNAVHDMVRDWSEAGVQMEVIPTGEFQSIAGTAPEYMRDFGLSSADAVHLVTAQRQAKTLITTDWGFERATVDSLDIIHVAP